MIKHTPSILGEQCIRSKVTNNIHISLQGVVIEAGLWLAMLVHGCCSRPCGNLLYIHFPLNEITCQWTRSRKKNINLQMIQKKPHRINSKN